MRAVGPAAAKAPAKAKRTAPRGLGKAGAKLWRSIVPAYDLREDEASALAAACRMADEVDRLEEALAGAPVMVAGSTGQARPNPLFAEVRAHRLALERLLKAVGLAEAEEDAPAAPTRSSAGRALARQRWSQVRG